MPGLEDLYREIILDHYRTPRNRGELDPPAIKAEGHNPLCGDEITVYLSGCPRDPETLEEYFEAGVSGVTLGVGWDADLDTVKRELDENVEFRDRYLTP